MYFTWGVVLGIVIAILIIVRIKNKKFMSTRQDLKDRGIHPTIRK